MDSTQEPAALLTGLAGIGVIEDRDFRARARCRAIASSNANGENTRQ